MTHIFVSHSSKDDDQVTLIHDALEAATGREVWVDHQDIAPGADWQIAIDDSLAVCESLLLVLSRHSAASREVTAEWRDALLRKKPVYIAIIDDLPIEAMSSRLRLIQSVNLHADWDKGLAAVIATIKGERLSDDAPVTPPRPITGTIDARLTTIPISGRDADLAQIKAHLNTGRPTLILGVGGLGKSRLAAELVVNYPGVDGAVWHRCSDISRADEVVVLLRQHFNLDPATERNVVLNQFRSHKRLIIIDNAESIPANDDRRHNYARLINELAQYGANVLLTSRVKWDEIEPPRYLYQPQQLEPAAAQQVVLDMAQTFNAPDAIQAVAADFAEAARYHSGLIDWGVRQTEDRLLDRVLADLRELKSADAQDALDEMIHKTLRQMVAAAGDAPENLLRRLAVCRGGFSFAAAEAIGGMADDETLETTLRTLQTWQFIRFDNPRYTIDPLVEAVLQPDASTHRPHYDYYEALAWEHHRKQDYLGLDVESDNLEVAFEWAFASGDYEAAYWLANPSSRFLANRGRFEQRKDWLERVATEIQDHNDKTLVAAVQNSLGVLYRNHPLGSRHENLRRAIAAYEEALRFYTPQAAPQDYAMTQNNLGNAYRDLAAINDREANLRRAIAAYEEALRFRTPQAAPLQYAMTQMNLGSAHADLAFIEDREANLRRSLQAYKEALRFYNPQAAPLDYAKTQYGVGSTYADLAKIEDQSDNLQNAVVAYQEALKFLTPQTDPLEYATTQNNLGNAYRDLAAINDREANLRRAIVAYDEALRFRTPQAAPLDYAMTQNNLGNAYRDLAASADREANLRRAIAAYEAALRFRTPQGAPLDYAQTQYNLGNIYQEMDNLGQAIKFWQEAEKYYRQMGQNNWADYTKNLVDDAEAKLAGGDADD